MSSGTQRSDMGLFAKFSLNLINVAIPNLIATDIVLTHPMSAMSGYVNYIKYVAGSTKGGITKGHVFNDAFRLGDVDPEYTSSRVTFTQSIAESAKTSDFELKWTPVIPGTVSISVSGTKYVDDGKGHLIAVGEGDSVTRRTIMVQPVEDSMSGDERFEGVAPSVETVVTNASGEPVTTQAGTIDYSTGKVTFTSQISGDVQIAYSYKFVVA